MCIRAGLVELLRRGVLGGACGLCKDMYRKSGVRRERRRYYKPTS